MRFCHLSADETLTRGVSLLVGKLLVEPLELAEVLADARANVLLPRNAKRLATDAPRDPSPPFEPSLLIEPFV
jgi:hypothetical protein